MREANAMGLLRALNKIRGGYPGGWKRYARGYQGDRPPPFVAPNDPDDRRSLIPAQGLREYWYPALPAKAVGWRKPVGLRLLGTDLVFFRDTHGEVQALWDYCPHRGVYLPLPLRGQRAPSLTGALPWGSASGGAI
jgi:hypothetical protein